MLDAKVHLCPRRGVGSELVGDHDARRRAGGLEELRHEPARRAAVSSTPNQNVEHEAVLIYRTPQPIWLSGDRNDDFLRCHLSLRTGARWRIWSGNASLNFIAHWRTVS